MDFRTWYVAFVWTGKEESVRSHIKSKLAERELPEAEYLLPRCWVEEYDKATDTKRVVLKLMFPGYVLIGTDDIEQVADVARENEDVLRFLKTADSEFYELPFEEIAWIAYLTDKEDIIGESEVCLDENDSIVVLSGPLKGEEGRIKRYNRREGRVAVEFLLGVERKVVWLGVREMDSPV